MIFQMMLWNTCCSKIGYFRRR